MLTVDQLVLCTSEHPHSVGKVLRVSDNGDAQIEFVTSPSPMLPYGHIITERWPVSDQHLLTVVE